MDKNTLVTIYKEDNDGNITGVQKILAESFETAEMPTGWNKLDNRPVIMKLVNGKYEDETNPDYDENIVNKINEYKQRETE